MIELSRARLNGKERRPRRGCLAALVCGALVTIYGSARCAGEAGQEAAKPTPFAIRDVRVFDGRGVIERATVLVRDGRIESVAPSNAMKIPGDARIIDGSGKTLLPGLIDSHTHVWGTGLEQSLAFGVTTDIDMFTSVEFLEAMKAAQAAGPNPDRADLVSSGTLATVPGGHGTEYGLAIPTLSKPEEAQAFVDARIAEGSDFIKIIYSHGWSFPSLDKPTLAALIRAAHNRKKLAAVHIDTMDDARDAIESGADILAHVWYDREPDEAMMALAREHHVVLIPTLTVTGSICGLKPGLALAEDARLEPFIPSSALAGLKMQFPGSSFTRENFGIAERTVAAFKRNRLTILAGTDAPNPGTAYGASLHQELELLTHAGLSPTEALSAATALPAQVFGLADRGRIAAGLRADLLLVEGDPTNDIEDTRRIAGIWKEGVELDRAAYREKIAEDNKAAAKEPEAIPLAASAVGMISDFEDSTLAGRIGSGWIASTDAMMGGKSTVALEIAPGGANGSRRSLALSGEVAAGPAYAWSGIIMFPAGKPFAPADLSSATSMTFWAKGDGQTYQILFYSKETGYMPLHASFICGPEWRRFSFALADFPNLDTAQITAVGFTAGPKPGPFSFSLDEIALE
jgi:imidazolonepropionase-like amidohydrolase